MERIFKQLFFIIGSIALLLIFLFVITWQSDGFHVAVNLFLGNFFPSLNKNLSFIGVTDKITSLHVALVICFAVQIFIGKRLSSKALSLIISISSGIVSFLGILLLLS